MKRTKIGGRISMNKQKLTFYIRKSRILPKFDNKQMNRKLARVMEKTAKRTKNEHS